MSYIQTGNQIITQITVIEAEAEKQHEALSLMADRARFMARQPGLSRSACIEASTAGVSSITSDGKAANSCSSPINRRA
jgi:hypothetical protein